MHEMSLAEGVLGVIEDAQRAQGAGGDASGWRVRVVRLEIGRLAAVELDALRFAFDVVKRDSVAADAALDVVEVPGAAWCMKCCETVIVDSRGEGCPRCGSYQLQITDGDQMRVRELELA